MALNIYINPVVLTPPAVVSVLANSFSSSLLVADTQLKHAKVLHSVKIINRLILVSVGGSLVYVFLLQSRPPRLIDSIRANLTALFSLPPMDTLVPGMFFPRFKNLLLLNLLEKILRHLGRFSP